MKIKYRSLELKYNPAPCRTLVLILIMLSGVLHSFAQSAEVDYNTYYQFPLSLGIEYQSLKPFGGESREIDITASYNQEIFTTEGITPLTGEIIADYISRNKAANQRFSVSYDLHDKTALSWDDDRKVAAFITPADSALTEIGVLYQVDPTSPFTAAQSNPLIVDSISLPRDTLKRATGDCDDLTVLYTSILETVGIETAFITVPGHIYAAFNTRVPSRSYKSVHPDRNMTLNINGELWIPVEITMIGNDDFLSAWRKGAVRQ